MSLGLAGRLLDYLGESVIRKLRPALQTLVHSYEEPGPLRFVAISRFYLLEHLLTLLGQFIGFHDTQNKVGSVYQTSRFGGITHVDVTFFPRSTGRLGGGPDTGISFDCHPT